ncbi:MAG: rRNA adenine methyltransferase [Verrucomicrobia bacterium]|nr:MAG: rRNA adenine methyltransferase [Verrucomicrobiota bacterium]
MQSEREKHPRAFSRARAVSEYIKSELNAYRRKLLQLRLIGVDSNRIGFGNLSIRDGTTNNFYITGSATGGMPELALADCTRVVAYDFKRNWLRCEGSAIASSESLTHAAVYESDAKAGAVIHCHDSKLWAALLNQAPTSSKAVEYGTPEMAYEVTRLFKITNVQQRRIFVMAGHEGGIVAFGRDLEGAFAILMREQKENEKASQE